MTKKMNRVSSKETLVQGNWGHNDDLSETRDASSEKLLLRAAPFDSCIFHLKVLTEGQQEAVVGEPTTTALRHQGLRRREVAVKGVVPNPRIRCEDCGFLADGLSGLNVHISMKHPSKEKHFHCLLCGKSFYTESNLWALNNHMKLHTGDKPYKCTCFASTTQSHLTRHKRVHTGEKPYRCPWCDYRMRSLNRPVVHSEPYTNDHIEMSIPFPCPLKTTLLL
uniref:Zinc finger protein 407 n=1 Tax=Electrophorus electricus TaxID=8005 RepID=A0AAY5EXQ4_ELEEL